MAEILIPGVILGLLAWVAYDVLQRKHAIQHNFPIIGHFRYWLEAVGPELRQYIVTGNDEERPFSRDQRSWVYASSKKENNYFGFGTDNDHRFANYVVTLRKELLQLCRACGVEHPADMSLDYFEILDECFVSRSASACFGQGPGA
jgi:glutamate synthase domain-containing protein 2